MGNKRLPGVSIPLDFSTAIEGLLKVDPTKIAKPKKKAAAKTTTKNASRKKK